jgi:hypothetical protein
MGVMADVVYLSGLTFAAVDVAKRAGLPSRYAGLAAIILGVLIACLDGYQRGEPSSQLANWVTAGIVAGLTAAGVYSGAKAATELPPRDARGRFTRREPAE